MPNNGGNCLKRYHLICHNVCESDHKVAWIVCRASTSGTTVLNEDIQRSVTIWCPVGGVMSDLRMRSRKLIGKDKHHPVLFWFPLFFFNVLPPNRPKKQQHLRLKLEIGRGSSLGWNISLCDDKFVLL